VSVRLRDCRLTFKPRIVKLSRSGFIVERLVVSNHPSARRLAQCKTVDTFAQAITLAHAWVGPKENQ